MLDRLSAVLHLETPGADLNPIFGALPEGVAPAALREMCVEKPSARKEAGFLVVTVPVGPAWLLWVFDQVPPVTELAPLIERVRGLSHTMVNQTTAAPSPGAGGPLHLMLSRYASAGRLHRKGVLQSLVDGIVETEAARGAIAFSVGRKRVRKMFFSDRNFAPKSDELRAIVFKAQQAGETQISARAVALDEADLDTALLARSFEAETVEVSVPEVGKPGYGVALIDPVPGVEADMPALRDLVALSLQDRTKAAPGFALRLRRLAFMSAGLALVAYLAWPAPQIITATGNAAPAEAASVALHFDAFLDEMHVSVGDEVAEGDLLASFLSPDLEERRSETALQIAVEEVAAQSALAQNDYGSFVLAEQRIEAQERRLENIDLRLERLGLRAPVAGRVIEAQGRGTAGSFVPTGEQVVLIQEAAQFSLNLNVLRVDAPMITPGQEGEVYFRGIAGESFPFRVTSPVLIERNPETGEEALTARAVIEAEDQSRLLAGLSGYARIETGTTPRVLNFGRYAVEYIKVQAWTYLGLRW